MSKRYILNLYKQYCEARGLACNPMNETIKSYDFFEWIAYNQLLAKEYGDYLQCLGYGDSRKIAEVGKGRYDSIAKDQMKVISPYADTLGLPNSELLILGNVPLIKQEKRIIVPEQPILLTHNPFGEMGIIDWSLVHNAGVYNISIGMFGNVHDEDRLKKVELLHEISKKMNEDHVISYDTDQDKYFYSLNSNRMIRKKELSR